MTRNLNLTSKQSQVLEFLRSYIKKHGESPTVPEMATALGLSSLRTVTQYLEALERRGLIRRARYQKRNITLLEDQGEEETVLVPVFASAGCGSLSIIAERKFDEFAPVAKSLMPSNKKSRLFVIRAVGDSMQDAGIYDGDLVLVEKTDDIVSNDIAVVIIDDTAVIKKITFANNIIVLHPVSGDAAFKPIILRRDYEIFGKVIDIIKKPIEEDYTVVPINEDPNSYGNDRFPPRG